jgi:hypothetical protein
MRLSCSYPILLYRPPGLKASAMICNTLYDILINWYLDRSKTPYLPNPLQGTAAPGPGDPNLFPRQGRGSARRARQFARDVQLEGYLTGQPP